jgi:hypothetical protein
MLWMCEITTSVSTALSHVFRNRGRSDTCMQMIELTNNLTRCRHGPVASPGYMFDFVNPQSGCEDLADKEQGTQNPRPELRVVDTSDPMQVRWILQDGVLQHYPRIFS